MNKNLHLIMLNYGSILLPPQKKPPKKFDVLHLKVKISRVAAIHMVQTINGKREKKQQQKKRLKPLLYWQLDNKQKNTNNWRNCGYWIQPG